MRIVLSREEMREFQTLSDPAARTAWLSTRAMAKDAVRRWMKRHHNRDLYPADVKITPAPHGKLTASGAWADETKPRPFVAAACCGPMAIGVASGTEIGVAAIGCDAGWEHCAYEAALNLLGETREECAALHLAASAGVGDHSHTVTVLNGEKRINVHGVRHGDVLIAIACAAD
jgi:hypothetical protein